jgi:hypothetical protein
MSQKPYAARVKTDPVWWQFLWAGPDRLAHDRPMNEWILLVYPLAVFGYLILAARWQPKARPTRVDRYFQQDGYFHPSEQ